MNKNECRIEQFYFDLKGNKLADNSGVKDGLIVELKMHEKNPRFRRVNGIPGQFFPMETSVIFLFGKYGSIRSLKSPRNTLVVQSSN